MASEILGMFGKNPQQVRNEYMNSNMVSPAQMGSQGLLQQVVSMGGNAGASLGNALGGMLGGQAPGEREAMAMQQAMQDSSDPSMTQAQRMRRMAELLSQQPGMGAQAMQAMAEARRLEAEDFTMEDAQFKRDNRTRDMKETRMVPDGLGGTTPKQFYWTETYNQETGKFEQATAPSTTPPPPAAAGDPLDDEADRRAKEKAGKTQGGGGERVGDVASPEFTGRAGLINSRERAQQQSIVDTKAQQETDQESERLLRRSTPSFKTVGEKEVALKAAVKAGNYGLASQINKSPPFRKY